ncbi:MAG: hypothetical protein LQ343_005789 [Gyalolechia ehrenbergii]|nr:MAG: hypothetical protein LQ343_005789 [Gyalolechia ehrenbergii]
MQLTRPGLSVLGTLGAPTLPQFLSGVGYPRLQVGKAAADIEKPLQNGFPWGSRQAARTNPYENSPTTGVIRSYDFTIARGYIAPDGVNKSVMLINGQFPGPTIEANWGDTFSINVHNQITEPEEGTALHWHGLLQRATPWFDGVPAVQQCPIAPGKSLTYTFKADLFGTSWYHSHYSAQYAGGLFGAMIVHGPHENILYDTDLGPVLLTDWYHKEYFDLVEEVMTNRPPPKSDNNLINGKMDFDCSRIPAGGPACTPNAGISKFNFESGKTHRLRLINAGADATLRFTIDNHTMTVIAQDFVPVVPFNTNVVTLGIGQRTDVIVKANMSPTSAVFMRSNLTEKCSSVNQPYAVAAIYYEKADKNKTPQSTATVFDNSFCGNDSDFGLTNSQDPLTQTKPLFPFPALQNAATTQDIAITFGPNSTGTNVWYMDKVSFRANYDHPVLLLAAAGNTSYPYDPQWNVYNFGGNASVRVIVHNNFFVAHPMHLHGHNFFVLAEGVGTWDGKITNYPYTQRRDVQIVQAQGYLVIQYDTDNPGVWPFHCHIAWHVSGGLYVNLMEHPDQIRQKVVPQTLAQTCRDWSEYSGHNIVEQIDSGL